MSSQLVPFSADGVSITPRVDEGVLRVHVAGAVEMREPGEMLNPYWTMIDEETRRLGIRRVEVDLRDLNFMNSSGILTLVRWITRAKGHPADANYNLVLQYDRNVTWQRTSIPTLAKLAPQIVVSAEIDGPAVR